MNGAPQRASWIRYTAAVSLVSAAVGIKLLLDAYSIAETPFFLVRAAVLVTAYFCGLGPALLALVLTSLAVDYIFLPPVHSFALTGPAVIRLVSFIGETLLIIWIIMTLKHARGMAERSAAELQESQLLFREFMRNNPAIAFMKDELGRHVYVNRTGEAAFGWKPGEWEGKTNQELWPGTTADSYETNDKSVLETGKLTKFLEEADLPVQGHRVFETYKFPLLTPTGQRFVGAIAVDVTERLESERIVREQQAQFRQLADSMPQIVWTALPDGTVDYVNKRWFEFTGFIRSTGSTEDEAAWTTILHPDEITPAIQQYQESLRSGDVYVRECRFRDIKTGEYRWYLVRVVPARNDAGVIEKWYGTATDVHDQKSAAEAAQYSEMRFRSLVTASSQIVWTANENGSFIERQASWEAYTGQQWEEYKGIGWNEAIHPDDRQFLTIKFERALETTSAFEASGRIWYSPTEQYRHFRMHAAPIVDDDGELREWIGTVTDIDEQHRAEEALQASVQRIQSIFESMTDAFFAVDDTWQFTYVNRQAEVLLRRKRETLLGKVIWDEFPDTLGTRFQREYEHAMNSRVPVQFEDYYSTLSTWFEVHVYPAEEGLSVYFRNITERRRAEDALKVSEAQFRATYEQAAVGIAQIGADGRYMRANAKFCEICGRPPEELGTLTYTEITHPDDRAGEEFLLKRLFRREIQSYTYEKRYVRKNGELAWVRATSSMAEEPNMPGTYRIVIVEDISDAKRAEEQLARSEERYRSLVTALAQIVWRADAAGNVEDIPGWRLLTGQTVEEVRGLGWLDALHPEDRGHVEQVWRDAVEGGRVYETEYRIRLKDDTYRWYSVRGAPVKERDGSVREWVGLCVDINDQKRAEVQMQQAAEAMAIARDAAVQASRSKSAFLANMSHELRTPLNAILGYTELLQEDLGATASEQAMSDLHRISTAGNTLLALVNDVLDLSKIEAGRMTLQLNTFDINELLSEVVATVRPQCERNNNALNYDDDAALGTMHSDQVKVRQTLLNLVSNACKFTENGAVRFSARREKQDGNEFIIFTVNDTGIGIAEEDQERLFQEFTQLDPSFTRKYSGTGLGLAISRRFVELMGGTITLESEVGKGTTFFVELPAVVQASPGGSVSSEG